MYNRPIFSDSRIQPVNRGASHMQPKLCGHANTNEYSNSRVGWWNETVTQNYTTPSGIL